MLDRFGVPLPPGVSRPPDPLELVRACPHRGPSVPVSEQAACGCPERYRCAAGRGASPGRVTMRDCLACVEGRG